SCVYLPACYSERAEGRIKKTLDSISSADCSDPPNRRFVVLCVGMIAHHNTPDVFETENIYDVGSLCTFDGVTLASDLDYNFELSFSCLVDDPFKEMGVDEEEYKSYKGKVLLPPIGIAGHEL
ncbi:uncharacterized protein PGTG_18504, partial [Puccinia graminis f. sp. tritici CRL 75-36-700-3]